MTTESAQIESHYATNWRRARKSMRLEGGRIAELSPEFRVLLMDRPDRTTAYATVCMSQPEDRERLELHLLSRASADQEEGLVELLTVMAHFHRTVTPLGVGHTVNFGRPWLPGSECTCALVSLPYLDGPKLEWMPDHSVRFLWVIPITPTERRFKIAHGINALEERFESTGFDYLDPLRPSVVALSEL
jgi:Suppressor of fused protein (SUFU)